MRDFSVTSSIESALGLEAEGLLDAMMVVEKVASDLYSGRR